MNIKFYAAAIEAKSNPRFTSEIITDKFDVVNKLIDFLTLNRNSDDPCTLLTLENIDTGEQLEFIPLDIHDEDILTMIHELDPSDDTQYVLEYTRKYFITLIDSIYEMLKERKLTIAQLDHIDVLELYGLKNTDPESEIIEKVATGFCNNIMNMITDLKNNSDIHNIYNSYKLLYIKIIMRDNALSFLKENGNTPTIVEYFQAYKIFDDFNKSISKLKDYVRFTLK